MTLKTFWNKFYMSIIFIAICTVFGMILLFMYAGENTKDYNKVSIKEGDSLWALADKYADESSMNKAQFISWVENENELQDCEVKAGEAIVIPVKQDNRLEKNGEIQLADQ